ncbi:hypothetical protein AB0C98_10965 [Streptomyces sp. NPDC048558]|uniref:hypothetical protein n=1 Tax=Streptomyces sp. NPDC048558 TaxID=3155759 RepID=UPI0033C8D884
MTAEADEYALLWNGTEEGWVVIRTDAGEAIYNARTQRALLIEDNAVAARVIELMREHGVQFLDSIP